MADLLATIKQGLAGGSITEQASPIVDEALKLVSNTEIPFQKRVEQIYALVNKAAAAGGVEKQRCGYVIENLYASASENELVIIKEFEASIA